MESLLLQQQQQEIMSVPTVITAETYDELCTTSASAVAEKEDHADQRLKELQARIALDAHRIWGITTEGQEPPQSLSQTQQYQRLCWDYFGYDAVEIGTHWKGYTLGWVLSLISEGRSQKTVEKKYVRYLKQFVKMQRALTKKMKKEQYLAAVEKYEAIMLQKDELSEAEFSARIALNLSSCLSTTTCIPDSSAATIIRSTSSKNLETQEECMNVSLIHHILRQRPDVIVRATAA